MKPIYFPFTFIPEPLMGDLNVFFPMIAVYQPSAGKIPGPIRKWADEGRVDLRAPAGGNEERLEKLVAEYRAWLDQHRGSDMTFFKTRLFDSVGDEAAPMFSETSTSQIKADIKRGGEAASKQKPDALLAARLFLLIAHEFDRQRYEIGKDLEKFRDLEKDLFSVMRGEDDFSEENADSLAPVAFDDVGRHKTAQRISAWLKLFALDPVHPDTFGSSLLLTPSEAVLDRIPEYHPEMTPVYSTGPVALTQRSSDGIAELQRIMGKNMEKLSKGLLDETEALAPETEESDEKRAQLKIYAFAGRTPETLFSEDKGVGTLETDETRLGESVEKTFVAKLEYL